MSDLSKFVKEWREKNDYSQAKLGKILKFSAQQVSNVERGTHPRPVKFCQRIIKLMKQKDKKELQNALYKTLLEKIDGIF